MATGGEGFESNDLAEAGITPNSRNEALQQIADGRFDVCVVGAGAAGAGCALDAQLRGLKTVLVDAGDFAGVTSSASTKLVHGGVRYLQQAVAKFDVGQLKVVKRALRERKLMLDNAPHLAGPLRLLVPCFSRSQLLYYGIGLKIYDQIAGAANLFPSRSLSREESLRALPELKEEHLVGTVAYPDGQFDDARYALAIVKTFMKAGGRVANYLKVRGFEKDSAGKLRAAQVEDVFSGQAFSVPARACVNATGPFSDSVVAMANPAAPKRIALSKGVHLLLTLDPDASPDALLIPKTEDGRVIFAIPWHGRLLVGTTDDAVEPGAPLQVTRAEAEYLLRHLNRYFKQQRTIQDIASAMVGVRPLVRTRGVAQAKKLIRDHEVQVDGVSGLISILGGKWTTHRAMAEETIDTVQQYLGMPVTAVATRFHPLVGSSGYSPTYWQMLVGRYGIPEATAWHLAQKYGTEAEAVLELAKQDATLLAPIVHDAAAIRAQIEYAIRYEMALTIEDVLARRIGLQLFGWRLAIRAAPVAASYLAEAWGWSPAVTQEATQQYLTKINRCLEVIGLPTEKVAA